MPAYSHLLLFARGMGICLFVIWTYAAIHYTVIGFDPALYHLPISSFIWNIRSAPDYFHLPILSYDEFWVGFPKTGELFQGLFWKLTGSIRGVVAPNIILVLVYVLVIGRVFRVPASLLVIGVFGNPQINQAYLQSYIDLIAALSLSTSFFLLARFLYRLEKGVWTGKNLWGGALLIAISATCKHTMLINSEILIVFLLCCLAARPYSSRIYKIYAGILLILIGIYIAGVSWTNLICYKNPLYPIKIEVEHQIIFPGPMGEYHESPAYPIAFMNFPPVLFFLSASELDWSIREVRVYYNLESSTGDSPAVLSPARTGGWGGLLFLFLFIWILFAVLTYPIAYFRSSKKKPGFILWFLRFFTQRRSFFFYVLMLGCVFLFVETLIPMAYELRYSNTIYLIMLPLALKWLTLIRSHSRGALVFFLVLSAYYQLSVEFSHSLAHNWNSQYTGKSEIKRINVKSFAKDRFFYMSCPLAFKYSYPYTGVPIKITEEPSERDITCPLNAKVESIILEEFLTSGWDIFPATQGNPLSAQTTIDVIPVPYPKGDLIIDITLGNVPDAAPLGYISFDNEPAIPIKPDSNNLLEVTIPNKLLKPGTPVHLQFSHLAVTAPLRFSVNSFILLDSKGNEGEGTRKVKPF